MANYSPALGAGDPSAAAKGANSALAVITMLFFMWGLLTALNDVLIPHLKSVYALTYVQAMLVQSCFFGAYFLVSVPAGALVRRIGYQRGVVAGLVLAALGCALFYPASLAGYGLFLFALFVLASGITILQVAANPYVTMLGPAAGARRRPRWPAPAALRPAPGMVPARRRPRAPYTPVVRRPAAAPARRRTARRPQGSASRPAAARR